jgi:hypothetical protein
MASNPAYGHAARSKELPDLLMDADLIRELTAHPAWEIVAGAIDAHHTNLFKAAEAEKLAQGQAPTREQTPAVEAAGGAVPGGNGEQPNPVHQVFASRGQGLPQGFG